MTITQISEHIWRLRLWVGIPIQVWIVTGKDGVTLVDAGLSGMAKTILAFIDRLNAGPLKRILLTHGHSDHVGAIPRILQKTPVPVLAHRIEIPFMEGDLPYPRRKKAAASIAPGVAQALPEDEKGQLEVLDGLRPILAPVIRRGMWSTITKRMACCWPGICSHRKKESCASPWRYSRRICAQPSGAASSCGS